MRLSTEIIKDNLIIRLEGELDHHTSEEVRRKIDSEYYNNNLLNMVLDLGGLNFMDSSGIGLIMGRYKNCKEQGGKLSIVNINSKVERILEMSGLMKIVNIYITVEEALKS
ncbi:MAG: anti-sigma F factor antagonist [Tissierellia bacterium]|nr:anti-sigma F factor antagonist [Tissierellia bacterium]